ncbi:TonB-dependent receptor [Dasania sp. GY-MA-18]|uniref:TonB-dependent receptor n=1 Tax=Dasania phycosphaerae TaxID=2950436 RepID=A0A9J6RJG8_9GAMM|nr:MULTISPECIES: TonB-dependent receptor plug domain-containing protein [Dasania]MCR8922085.1 TonB-dependent receptor [Dasania sp. GY-MA-18]MCZ0864513.1 TonB-dependent receptor [Dasania phycosphaerae]MCZ0868241.1 TonB-dependent receptor [Dasania phycosphaerae]
MFRRNKIAQAILIATATSAATTSHAAGYLEEVVVTSTKSFESMQDVAISVQAMGEEKLEQLNISNFDDYIKYLPGVNAGGRGPGQSTIFIRGMATDSSDQTSVEIGAPVPNVALYLDEQPVSSTGRNLDVYAADLERVEVLPGPQGTLFGASSQAGTVRLITNKPQLNEFSGGVDVSLSTTKNGSESHSFEGVVNVPLVEDKLAARLVGYRVTQGGFIDNVYGERTFNENDLSFPTGATALTVNNSKFVEKDFNETVYTGARLGIAMSINDDWDALFQYMNQKLDVDGVFDHSPDFIEQLDPNSKGVGDLEVQRFSPDENEDKFQQYGITINGHINDFDLVYAGSYLDREVNSSYDYTGYTAIGTYAAYYICNYPAYTVCGDPTQSVDSLVENTRQTHEFRFSYIGERLNTVAGVYYDDAETSVDTQFVIPGSIDAGLFRNAPLSGATQFKSGLRPAGTTFINDATRSEEQLAAFGEISYDIVPDSFSATFGYRYYDIEYNLVGSSSFASRDDGDYGRNYDEILKDVAPGKESGDVVKVTLEFTPNEDTLLYYTYSEGFRPGGFNRAEGVPESYETDEVTSQEIGWKLDMLDGSLRFNGALYHVDWKDMQIGVLDIANFGVLTFVANAADAEVWGLEGDVSYAATEELTLFASFSWNQAEMASAPTLTDDGTPTGNLLFIEEGEQLALAPELQYNLRARYEMADAQYSPYAQIVYSFTDSQYSSIVEANRYKQDSYIGVDASIGMQINESLGVELFGENLTDERAELFINSLDSELRVTTNRPRTIGIRMAYDF